MRNVTSTFFFKKKREKKKKRLGPLHTRPPPPVSPSSRQTCLHVAEVKYTSWYVNVVSVTVMYLMTKFHIFFYFIIFFKLVGVREEGLKQHTVRFRESLHVSESSWNS